jgi:3-hydroxyisobutyrate dehydrogenase
MPCAGFIGLGNMGGAIAARLLGQGVALHVHDPSPDAAARAFALGATVHPSPRAVGDHADVVFGCLPTVAIANQALHGPDGAAKGSALKVYVEMSTVGPDAAALQASSLARVTIGFVDAAVSGGAAAALSGTLAIMISAPEAQVASVRPLLSKISDRIFVVGERPGQGQTMKLINNLLAAANMANSFEALALGVKLGLEPESMVEVINAGSGKNTGLVDRRVNAILTRGFDSGPKIALLGKDIELALEQARRLAIEPRDLPALFGMASVWAAAMSEGMAGDDVSALMLVIEKRLNVIVEASSHRAADQVSDQ